MPNDKPQGRGASPRPAGGAGWAASLYYTLVMESTFFLLCVSGVFMMGIIGVLCNSLFMVFDLYSR